MGKKKSSLTLYFILPYCTLTQWLEKRRGSSMKITSISRVTYMHFVNVSDSVYEPEYNKINTILKYVQNCLGELVNIFW